MLPPGLGPDQSRVCQFAGTQTASLYTHSTEQRERERGRETPTQTGRGRFGPSSRDQKASFCLKSGLCGGQKASASAASYSPQYERVSKRESRVKGWTPPTGRK